MTARINILKYLLVITIVLFYITSSNAAFTTSDLSGTWYGHALGVGDWTGWEYSTATINSSGSASINWNASDGDSATGETHQLNIDSTGIITVTEEANFQGVMSLDKNFFVATDTWDTSGNGEYSLITYIKGGGSFSTSNLAGTWYGHALGTGSVDGWERSTATINSSGNVNIDIYRSDGTSSLGQSIQANITGSGVVTLTGFPSSHGIMTLDKNLFIITDTWDTEGEGHYAIQTFVKGGGSFVTSDLEGTWSGHSLGTGGWNGWDVSTATITSTGGVTLDFYASDGDSGTGETYQLNITSGGIVTVTEKPSAHGIMSLDKNIIIITDTPASGEYFFQIFVKQAFEPSIATDKASYNFGSSDESEDIEIWNDGTGTLDYTVSVSEGHSYFSISPGSGSSTGSDGKQTHTITVDRSLISEGETVTGEIQIFSGDASNSPQYIPLSARKIGDLINISNVISLLLLHNQSTSLSEGAIAYYPLDGNAEDQSGNGYNGTITGATATTDHLGQPGKALSFDGNAKISSPLSVAGKSALSVSLWVKFDVHDDWNYMVAEESGGHWGYVLENRLGVIQLTLKTSDSAVVQTVTAPTLGTWVHIVTTFDGTESKVYINGVLEDTASISGTIYDGLEMWFGALNTDRCLNGDMDELVFWDRALSASEVISIYSATE